MPSHRMPTLRSEIVAGSGTGSQRKSRLSDDALRALGFKSQDFPCDWRKPAASPVAGRRPRPRIVPALGARRIRSCLTLAPQIWAAPPAPVLGTRSQSPRFAGFSLDRPMRSGTPQPCEISGDERPAESAGAPSGPCRPGNAAPSSRSGSGAQPRRRVAPDIPHPRPHAARSVCDPGERRADMAGIGFQRRRQRRHG